MAYNQDSSASGSGNYDGYPFPPTSSYGQPSTSKMDPPSGGLWSPGFPLESPSTMPWYFSATSPFNFTQAFASSSDGRPLSSGGYFPPYPPQQQQPAQHFAPHQQPAPPPPSFHPSLPQQQQSQPHQPPYHAPWQPSSIHPDPHSSSRSAPTFLAPAPPRTQTFDPRAHPSSISPPTVDRRLSNVASSVPPGLMRDNSSSRSSLSSTSSAASSQLGPAQLLPMYVDMSLVDGRPTHKTAPTEIQPGDDDDDGGHAIVAFPTEPPPGRRSTRKPAVVDHEMRDDVDAEGEDEDDGEGEGEGDEDDHVSETESVASSSSSYNGGRVRKSSASSSTFKRKPKSATQPLPPSVSASAKSSPGTTSAKRRASAPSHLQPSRAPTDATSPPPSPLKRARPTPSLAIRYEDDELSLPPLPADFDSYGPGGSSRFTDDQGSGGGIAIPDFSGREDCWGIGKEAYQQLSAKAKKQLRNKLGARRFRERRKEYITTLEERIAGRDDIITQTRDRLRNSIQLVSELKAKVAALEQASSG